MIRLLVVVIRSTSFHEVLSNISTIHLVSTRWGKVLTRVFFAQVSFLECLRDE